MRVLFLCTGNSCRSQMGEILLRRLRPAWTVASAGVEAHGLNPRMLQVMSEEGHLPPDLRSKTLDDLAAEGQPLAAFDQVFSLCGDALDRCPGKHAKATQPKYDKIRKKTQTGQYKKYKSLRFKEKPAKRERNK